MLIGLLLLLQQDSAYIRVESLLAAHDLAAARSAAERLAAAHPGDARAHLLLGQVWYAWPVTGRYPALAEFRTAARLAPEDPLPFYWQVRVGVYLGGDEGEAIAREAVLRIFALTPDYEDCWKVFQGFYRSPETWRRADEALARHPKDPVALERRAKIAIAVDQPERADSLAARAIDEGGPSLARFLLRAEAAFDRTRDSSGYVWYDSALAHAAEDGSGSLWEDVRMIATPGEDTGYGETTPTDRRSFFERFWSQRDPDLLTSVNERIAEHYRRLREARAAYPLLHPFSAYIRSPWGRQLAREAIADSLQAAADSYQDTLDPTLTDPHTSAGSRQNVFLPNGATALSAATGLRLQGLF